MKVLYRRYRKFGVSRRLLAKYLENSKGNNIAGVYASEIKIANSIIENTLLPSGMTKEIKDFLTPILYGVTGVVRRSLNFVPEHFEDHYFTNDFPSNTATLIKAKLKISPEEFIEKINTLWEDFAFCEVTTFYYSAASRISPKLGIRFSLIPNTTIEESIAA